MLTLVLASLLGSPAAMAEDIPSTVELPAATYVSAPAASYPMMAEQTGQEAECRVRVIADKKGRPIRADIDRESQPEGACPEPFRTQAIYAAWRGRLAPVEVDGQPTAFTFVQSVAFAPYQGQDELDDLEMLDAIVDSSE